MLRAVKHGLLGLLIVLSLGLPATAHAAEQPYAIRQYDTRAQSVLFILQPNATDQTSAEQSRRNLDIFRQIVSSYWQLTTDIVEVNDYRPNQAANYDVIVMVDEYGETLPQALTRDLTTLRGKEIVHFGLGGEKIINAVSSTRAHAFIRPVPLYSAAYKGVKLGSGPYLQDVQYTYNSRQQPPTDSTAQTLFWVYDEQGQSYPGAIRIKASSASNYLLIPYTIPRYYDTQTYTTALLDVLHEAFGDITDYPKQALVRLEDVNAYTYAAPRNSFFDSYDILRQRNIPFHIAYIQRYVDPEKSIDTTLSDHRHFAYQLKEMLRGGSAVLVQHGYTHQYQQEISAIGFEFWDSRTGMPAAEDSPDYARDRVQQAQAGMRADGLPVPDIWETPHYALGPNADAVFNELYPLRYEHIRGIGSLPFPVLIDGAIYIPETLDYIDSAWEDELPQFKRRLEQLQVFRNAVPSFFWHPWRDTHELETLVDLIQGQGYKFQNVYDMLQPLSAGHGMAAYQLYQNNQSGSRSYHLVNTGILILYAVLILGVLRYIFDSYRFRKYFRSTLRFNQSLNEIKQLYKRKNKPLPNFTIFVPARNEGLVIANTIANLAQLDYPKTRYRIVVITDERELHDDVPILTRDAVMAEAGKLNKRYRTKLVTCIEVPAHYSGVYKSRRRTYKKSTKGRALNYALQTYKPPKKWLGMDFIGVLDADGRMNRHTLKEAAYETLKNNAQILQGPVYQVSNLSKVSIVGVMAGLELARFHLSHMMPRLMHRNKVQFLAGTNYFISHRLLDKVRGWDQDALVEDAELALRVYTKERLVARALTLAEIEQTPASFKIYQKQRERWARGHFEMMGAVLSADIPLLAKLTFIRKILISQLRFIIDLGLPLIALYFLIMGYLSEVEIWMQIASVILLISLIFMWDIYGQTYRRMVMYSDQPGSRLSRLWMRCKLFLFMPVFMIIQAIPRMIALYNFLVRKKIVWAKTERTAEDPVLSTAARGAV